MSAELRELLGGDELGSTAMALLAGSLSRGTYNNYGVGMRRFAAFCEQEHIHPLQATTVTVVRYTAWLALQGTIGADSLQQYYSAINKYFRDHRKQPVAMGEMLADARRGLEAQQELIEEEDVRVAMPAPIMHDILTHLQRLRSNTAWTPDNIATLQVIRASLASVTNYLYFCRAETGVTCPTGDVVVDRPSGQILLFVRKSKGDLLRRTTDKPLLQVPIDEHPIVADLLEWYTAERATFCATYYMSAPPADHWAITPLEPTTAWRAGDTLSEWLQTAYTAVGASPPPGFKWTSHSLRKGAASAASCIGAPMPVIKFMGGWAKNSSVTEGKYIEPTMRPTPAAWLFFGWLVPIRPQHA